MNVTLKSVLGVIIAALAILGGASSSDAQDKTVTPESLAVDYTRALVERMGKAETLPDSAVGALQLAIEANFRPERRSHEVFARQLADRLEKKDGPLSQRLALVLLDIHENFREMLRQADLSDDQWASVRVDDQGALSGSIRQVGRLPWPFCLLIDPTTCDG